MTVVGPDTIPPLYLIVSQASDLFPIVAHCVCITLLLTDDDYYHCANFAHLVIGL